MINYSLVKRGNPSDIEAVKKYYATAQYDNVISLEDFAKHISEHGSTYSRADVYAIITQMVDCLKEQLIIGNRISLGELGSFYLSMKGTGTENAADWTVASNLKSLDVKWSKGRAFKNLINEKAQYQQVPSRKVQAETLKNLNN